MKELVKKIAFRLYPPRHAVFFLQRMVMHPDSRHRLARWAGSLLPELPSDLEAGHFREVEALQRDGYVGLSELVSGGEIDDVKRWLADKPVSDRWNPGAGLFSADDPPGDCHTAPYRDMDVVNCPHVLRWANDPRVLAIVGKSLGAKPTLSNLTIWWSYPGHDTPQEAESFHRDVDDLHFIKLFIYLTDVDEGCGPHAFVPRSQSDPRLRKIKRYEDAEVTRVFGNDCIRFFTGPAGTAFLENTFGLHKGQLPARGRRLLFQAQYSLHPIGIYKYTPIARSVDDGLRLDSYINRLFVKK